MAAKWRLAAQIVIKEHPLEAVAGVTSETILEWILQHDPLLIAEPGLDALSDLRYALDQWRGMPSAVVQTVGSDTYTMGDREATFMTPEHLETATAIHCEARQEELTELNTALQAQWGSNKSPARSLFQALQVKHETLKAKERELLALAHEHSHEFPLGVDVTAAMYACSALATSELETLPTPSPTTRSADRPPATTTTTATTAAVAEPPARAMLAGEIFAPRSRSRAANGAPAVAMADDDDAHPPPDRDHMHATVVAVGRGEKPITPTAGGTRRGGGTQRGRPRTRGGQTPTGASKRDFPEVPELVVETREECSHTGCGFVSTSMAAAIEHERDIAYHTDHFFTRGAQAAPPCLTCRELLDSAWWQVVWNEGVEVT